MTDYWKSVEQEVSQATGHPFWVTKYSGVGGGCINNAVILDGMLAEEPVSFFVKTNQADQLGMFVAEAEALKTMQSAAVMRVPTPVCTGCDKQKSFIVMELLRISGGAFSQPETQRALARNLAAMHEVSNDDFGWGINNTIGSTAQVNTPMADWLNFWAQHRLGFQLGLAAKNGYGGELQVLGERVLADLPLLFTGRKIKPSMLHGDLWGGNAAALEDGTPVIFDPALYFGDYEADLAMTRLFGGFSPDFYAAYHEVSPQEAGYNIREALYNSYHIINHLNMFGGGYQQQAIHLLTKVIAEL